MGEGELTLDSIWPGACLFEGKISVSALEVILFAFNRAVLHPYLDVEKKLSQDSVVLDMNVQSKVVSKMSQFQCQVSHQYLLVSLVVVIKNLKNQVRSLSKLVAVRSKDTFMKLVPLSSPHLDHAFSVDVGLMKSLSVNLLP